MLDRYATPQMRDLWAPKTRFDLWLEIELAAAEAQADLGLIPPDVAARLRREARSGSPERIAEIERTETHHDVVAFLRSVAEETGELAGFLHRGLGSADVVETAQAVLLVRAADLIDAALDELSAALRDLAQRHRVTVMAGRTHGVVAEPITFGLKVALWSTEVLRGRDRLRRAREGVRVGKLSGEVGNYAHLDPAVEAVVCRRMGLLPAPISSQILQRDRHAEYVSALAVLGGTLERIATDIRTMQRTEIREVEEPFEPGQTGSSAMPHKRNPILCERICGLARVVRGHAHAALENQALWGERDISHSSAERIIFPEATTLIHYMVRTLTGVIRGLVVYPEAMRRNLWRYGGVVFSHAVFLALMEEGLPREEAYAAVQSAAMAAQDEDGDFKALIAARHLLAPARLEACFDLEPYLRHVDEIFDRVFAPEPVDVGRG
jgi:adenylosuccinate lyase